MEQEQPPSTKEREASCLSPASCGCVGGELYRDEGVKLLLGESWHPGGLELTRRLVSTFRPRGSDLVLDVACGIGASSRLISREFGCQVVGVDLLGENLKEAVANATKEVNPSPNVAGASFVAGDAQHLPINDESLDAAVLECVVSAFSEKPAAVDEIARVLKPGGTVGLTDIIVEGELSEELKSPVLQGFCIGGALSLGGYVELLERGGFDVIHRESEAKDELLSFLEEIRRKLIVAQMLAGIGKLQIEKEDLDYAKALVKSAKEAVREGRLGYCVVVARKKGAV